MKLANVIALTGALMLGIMAPASAAPSATPMAQQTITGKVLAVTASSLTVRTPDHGPGLSHGPGIHSMLIIAGKTLQIDLTHAAWRKMDGTGITRPHLAVGDPVTVYATPGQNGTYRATAVLVTTRAK